MPARLIILEDDPRQSAALVGFLSSCPDFQITGCAASLTALEEILQRFTCDLALVDIQLPAGSGLDAIQLLKNRPNPPKVIVRTVVNDSATLFQALRAGADGYLLKDGDPKSLPSRLRELLQGELPMSPAIARRVLTHFQGIPPAHSDSISSLTPSERAVLMLLARGHSNQEIADLRQVSLPTVRSQLSAIYSKLHVRSRTEAVAVLHKGV